ncbi:MAG TPA: hypothetical protein VGR35_02220 [Tepidisphaeraceae bacterium]|nr:hypothetical protein [Tepidisphaeraceae bacterium]
MQTTSMETSVMGMALVVIILLALGLGLFALGYLVGRRSRPTVRGFDVVAVHDEKQH